MPSNTWLVYGANGYTGSLIARTAVQQGLRPIFAGWSPARIAPLAAELGLDHRPFALEGKAAVEVAPADVAVVFNLCGLRSSLIGLRTTAWTSGPAVYRAWHRVHWIDLFSR